jgi:protein-tyrosine phosphatase
VIDTHCHLLPQLDDGPATEEEAVALARGLARLGVFAIVCTPHYSRRYPTSYEDARDRLDRLEHRLRGAGVSIALSLAAEISPAYVVSQPGDELKRRSLGGRFVLVELLPDTPAVFLETALEHILPLGLKPVFAHPERCAALQSAPRLLGDARAGGALVQIVASSLAGRWGSRIALAAWGLLDAGVIDLLASDSHHARSTANLQRAVELVRDRYGADALEDLVERRPAQMLKRPPKPV